MRIQFRRVFAFLPLRCRPAGRPLESVPACAYGEEKKKPECREVAVEIIASSYCRRYQNIFQRANGFLASPVCVTQIRVNKCDGWFPLA